MQTFLREHQSKLKGMGATAKGRSEPYLQVKAPPAPIPLAVLAPLQSASQPTSNPNSPGHCVFARNPHASNGSGANALGPSWPGHY